MNIGIKNTVSTNLSGIEQGAMNSLREKRGGGGGGKVDSGRATSPKVSLTARLSGVNALSLQMLFPFPYERLSPMVCNKIEFHYSSMRPSLVPCHICKIPNARRPEMFFLGSSTI